MKICYQEKNFRDKSLGLIELCNEIIADFKAQGYDPTLRQIYYQLVAKVVIENNEKSYDNIGALISDARLAGLIDWDAIIDRTRNLRSLPHWNDPSEIIAGAAKQFNYDLWEGQSTRVEVWVEKDALVDIVAKAATPYDVPFFSCRGYTSQSEMWGAAQRILGYYDQAEKVVILHLGDHDPSGLDMTRDITERLAGFCEYHEQPAPIVKRIALNMNQVRQYNPPPNPAKLTDCRVNKYIALHGRESWELDALHPSVIHKLIQDNIQQLLDQELFDVEAARQKQARAELQQISEGYDSILSGQKELATIHEELEKEGVDTVTELADKSQERAELLDKATKEIAALKAKLAKKKPAKAKRPTAKKAKDTPPTLEQLRELQEEANRSCRCDGGGTLCGACVAEKKLKNLGRK